jgi:hypothetical protein
MSPEARILPKQLFITDYVHEFRETKNVVVLVKALLLVLRQRRTLELIYGGFCHLFHRPSQVYSGCEVAALASILNQCESVPHGTLSRTELIRRFGRTFKVALLPHDFQSARVESIWHDNRWLIIGEYGEHPRVAYVTPELCVISDYYLHVSGVKHIHSILKHGDSGEFLVCTGDTKKFLDLWKASNLGIDFARRLSARLAGFTAAVTVNGRHYFGTDFSGRPNFLATLEGRKFFFPKKAYKLYVNAFQAFFDRFIVSINTEFRIAGGRKTLSVFDTTHQRFIYCEYWHGGDALSPEEIAAKRASSRARRPGNRNGVSGLDREDLGS